ncbi:hypothetical protein GCM10008967_17640 [Bacillus carboniphilus]|uniref:Uncharacterized protein n=1 Tax=Bacillus carboniphilus TaxID=86663 RepID=A0ABN0W785_9BACI
MAISCGIAMKNFFTYAPTVGWIMGFVFFVISSIYAMKWKQESKGVSNKS